MSGIDPIAAEARAVEQGAHARLQRDGSFLVRSATRDRSWRLTVEVVNRAGQWCVRVRCQCESGSARPSELVACWHGALVARRLEREGWATWQDGAWWLTDVGRARIARLNPQSGLGPPPTRMRGRCPICNTFLSITVEHDDKRSPKEIATHHCEECRDEYASRKTDGREVDLWER